jgi:hypothetical protein
LKEATLSSKPRWRLLKKKKRRRSKEQVVMEAAAVRAFP